MGAGGEGLRLSLELELDLLQESSSQSSQGLVLSKSNEDLQNAKSKMATPRMSMPPSPSWHQRGPASPLLTVKRANHVPCFSPRGCEEMKMVNFLLSGGCLLSLWLMQNLFISLFFTFYLP